MYTAYFGLLTKPFELVPNPLFLFNSHSHKKAINYLKYGLQERVGFILLAGEVGSGKTTIIRDIMRNLDDDIVLSQVFNTSGSATEILALINDDFGLQVDGKEKVALLRDLNDYLLSVHAEGKRAVIIIDEAQNLTADVLEEIRLLSNLEAKNAKLVQIVLVGQPELQALITRPELRQLRQRIGVHCRLEALTREETEAYIYHRLTTAGNGNAVTWQEGTFDAIHAYSGGCPRMINVFCDFAMLCAYVENSRTVTLDMVNEIVGDISWEQRGTTPGQSYPVVAKEEPKQADGILEILRDIEQRLTRLEAMDEDSDSIARYTATHEALLRQLSDQNSINGEILNTGLAKIERQLSKLVAVVEKRARRMSDYMD